MPTQTHQHDADRVYQWLATTLSGDATLAALVTGGWWRGYAEDNAVDRTSQIWGVYSRSGGTYLDGVGAIRVVADDIFLIKVIGKVASEADDSALVAAADRIDALLHGKSGTTADGNIPACTNQGQVDYDENFENVRYRHVGGSYLILAQPLTGA